AHLLSISSPPSIIENLMFLTRLDFLAIRVKIRTDSSIVDQSYASGPAASGFALGWPLSDGIKNRRLTGRAGCGKTGGVMIMKRSQQLRQLAGVKLAIATRGLVNCFGTHASHSSCGGVSGA